MLTYKQKEVLEYITFYQIENKTSPTIQEISNHVGVSSLSTTHQHLELLEEKGMIKRHKKLARAIEVTDFAKKIITIKTATEEPVAKRVDIEKMRNTIVHGDTLELMRKLPDHSVDLIVADPPYNLSKGMSLKLASGNLVGSGGNWEKVMQKWDDYSLLGYMEFTELWLRESKRVLKPTGSMWVFGTYHNIGIINTLMQLLDIEIINEVVWYKRNAFPNLAGRRLTASHETLIWAHGGKKRKYNFNYDYSKAYTDKSDGLKAANKQMRTVWDIPNNKERFEIALGKHPTQKPLKICKRMIELSSDKKDIILAPFSGSGSECLAAQISGRDYIGFEIEEEFVKLSRKRLKHQSVQDKIV